MKHPIDKASVPSNRNSKSGPAGLGARLAASTAAMRKRDVIDVRKAPKALDRDVMQPTPEQMRHADFVLSEVHDRTADGKSIRLGKAYQRQARFEAIEGLSSAELKALRAYRAAFDKSAISETKSALDIRPRGGDGGESAIFRVANMAFANIELRRIEDRLPIGSLATLRAVALYDQDFKAVAIARFGGRDVQTVVTTGKKSVVKTSVQPRSGRHREIIRTEFMDGARALTAIASVMSSPVPLVPAVAVVQCVPPAPAPAVNPAYLDDRGILLPSAEIADIIRQRSADEAA